MKLDMTQKLKGIDGTVLVADKEDLTLRKVCTNALLGSYDDERISGEEKFKRWQLSLKVNVQADPTNVDLTPEEISKIKELVGKAYAPIVVGPAFTALNG